jgi:hypothetical protein
MPVQRRITGGSGRPRIDAARSQVVVRVLWGGEVERLVVGMGVADGQLTVAALGDQQLHVVLGRHGAWGGGRRAAARRTPG